MHKVRKRREADRLWKKQEKVRRRKSRKSVTPTITLEEKAPQNAT